MKRSELKIGDLFRYPHQGKGVIFKNTGFRDTDGCHTSRRIDMYNRRHYTILNINKEIIYLGHMDE